MSYFQNQFQTTAIPTLERVFGLPATLAQGNKQTAEFTVLWDAKVYSVIDSEGFGTEFQSRDFTFAKEALVLDGSVVRPRGGDRIILTENGQEVIYEILPIGKIPAIEEEPGGMRWKVHTKRIGS